MSWDTSIPAVMRTGVSPHTILAIGQQVWPYPFECMQTAYQNGNWPDQLFVNGQLERGTPMPSNNMVGLSGSGGVLRLCFGIQTRIRGGMCAIPHTAEGVGPASGNLMSGQQGELRKVWTPLRAGNPAEFLGTTNRPITEQNSDAEGQQWWNQVRVTNTFKYGCMCFNGQVPAEPVFATDYGMYYMDWATTCGANVGTETKTPLATWTNITYEDPSSAWPFTSYGDSAGQTPLLFTQHNYRNDEVLDLDFETSGSLDEDAGFIDATSSLFYDHPETDHMWGLGTSADFRDSYYSSVEVLTYCDGKAPYSDMDPGAINRGGDRHMGCTCANSATTAGSAAGLFTAGLDTALAYPYRVSGGRDFSIMAAGPFSQIQPRLQAPGGAGATLESWSVLAPVCRSFRITLPPVAVPGGTNADNPLLDPTELSLTIGNEPLDWASTRISYSDEYTTPDLPINATHGMPSGAGGANRVCGPDNDKPWTAGTSTRYAEGTCECLPGWYDTGYDKSPGSSLAPVASRLATVLDPNAVLGDELRSSYGLWASFAMGSAYLIPLTHTSPLGLVIDHQPAGTNLCAGPGVRKEELHWQQGESTLTSTYLCSRHGSVFARTYRCAWNREHTSYMVTLAAAHCLSPISTGVAYGDDWFQCSTIHPTLNFGTYYYPSDSCGYRFPPTCGSTHCTNLEFTYTPSLVSIVDTTDYETNPDPSTWGASRTRYTCTVDHSISANYLWTATVQQGPQVQHGLQGCTVLLINRNTGQQQTVFATPFPNAIIKAGLVPQTNGFCGVGGCIGPSLVLDADIAPPAGDWENVFWEMRASDHPVLGGINDKLLGVSLASQYWDDWLGPFPAMLTYSGQDHTEDPSMVATSQFCNCLVPGYYVGSVGSPWDVEDSDKAQGMHNFLEEAQGNVAQAKILFDAVMNGMCDPTSGNPVQPAVFATPCSPGSEYRYRILSEATGGRPETTVSCSCPSESNGAIYTNYPTNVPTDDINYLLTNMVLGTVLTDYVGDPYQMPVDTPQTPQTQSGYVRATVNSALQRNCRGNSCGNRDFCNPFEVTTRPFWQDFADREQWDEVAFDQCVTGVGSNPGVPVFGEYALCLQHWREKGVTVNECKITSIPEGTWIPQAECVCDNNGVSVEVGTPFGLWFVENMHCAGCLPDNLSACQTNQPSVGDGGLKCWQRVDDYGSDPSQWAGVSPYCTCQSIAGGANPYPNPNGLGINGCTAYGDCQFDLDAQNMACECAVPGNGVDGVDAGEDCRGCKNTYGPQWTTPGAAIACSVPLGPGAVEGEGTIEERYENLLTSVCGGYGRGEVVEATDDDEEHYCLCNLMTLNVYPPKFLNASIPDTLLNDGTSGANSYAWMANLEPDFGSPLQTQAGWTIPADEATCTQPICMGFCNAAAEPNGSPGSGDSPLHKCTTPHDSTNGLENTCVCADFRGILPGEATYNAHFMPFWVVETDRWQDICAAGVCQNGWGGAFCDIQVCTKNVFDLVSPTDPNIICGSNFIRVDNGAEPPRYELILKIHWKEIGDIKELDGNENDRRGEINSISIHKFPRPSSFPSRP